MKKDFNKQIKKLLKRLDLLMEHNGPVIIKTKNKLYLIELKGYGEK